MLPLEWASATPSKASRPGVILCCLSSFAPSSLFSENKQGYHDHHKIDSVAAIKHLWVWLQKSKAEHEHGSL